MPALRGELGNRFRKRGWVTEPPHFVTEWVVINSTRCRWHLTHTWAMPGKFHNIPVSWTNPCKILRHFKKMINKLLYKCPQKVITIHGEKAVWKNRHNIFTAIISDFYFYVNRVGNGWILKWTFVIFDLLSLGNRIKIKWTFFKMRKCYGSRCRCAHPPAKSWFQPGGWGALLMWWLLGNKREIAWHQSLVTPKHARQWLLWGVLELQAKSDIWRLLKINISSQLFSFPLY